MSRIDEMIETLAGAFCECRCDEATYIKSMQSLVKFAIAENEAQQINNVRADMLHINRIFSESKRV